MPWAGPARPARRRLKKIQFDIEECEPIAIKALHLRINHQSSSLCRTKAAPRTLRQHAATPRSTRTCLNWLPFPCGWKISAASDAAEIFQPHGNGSQFKHVRVDRGVAACWRSVRGAAFVLHNDEDWWLMRKCNAFIAMGSHSSMSN